MAEQGQNWWDVAQRERVRSTKPKLGDVVVQPRKRAGSTKKRWVAIDVTQADHAELRDDVGVQIVRRHGNTGQRRTDEQRATLSRGHKGLAAHGFTNADVLAFYPGHGTLRQAAQRFGISQERVRQIWKQGTPDHLTHTELAWCHTHAKLIRETIAAYGESEVASVQHMNSEPVAPKGFDSGPLTD